MSAFVVEDKTINDVIGLLRIGRDLDWLRDQVREETGCDLSTQEGCEELGKAMFDLNCEAVNQRYGPDQAQEFRTLDYAFRLTAHASTMQAYKSLGSWRYQCSEGNVPDTSLLFSTMGRVYDALAHHIVSRMAEYEKARW